MSDEETTSENLPVPVQKNGPCPDSVEVRDVIRSNVYLAMGVGVVPLPFLNILTDALVQVRMVRALCRQYNVEYKESLVKNIISSVVGGAAAMAITPVIGRAAMGVPLVGLPLAVATQPVLNGMTTYAIGRMFAQHFHTGGSLINCGINELTESFSAAFRESRQWVGDLIAGNKGSKAEPAPAAS